MTSRTRLVLVVAVLLLQVSCSSNTDPVQGVIQPPDFQAFFMHPSRKMDKIEFRVVGATNIDVKTTLFVSASSDVDQGWVSKLESYFSVNGSAVEVRMVEGIGPGPEPEGSSALGENVKITVPVYAGTPVLFKKGGRPGTIGCRLTNGKTFLLSNNHVLANTNQKPPGTGSFQHGNQIGTLVAADCLSLHGCNNLVDAAVACTTPECIRNDTPDFLFAPILGRAGAHDRVKKWGRASGEVRKGIVESRGGGVYEARLSDGETYCFKDQILVTDDNTGPPFAEPGDSGSVVVNENQQPVGLHFARIRYKKKPKGRRTEYVVNDMQTVLSRLEDRLPTNWKSVKAKLSIDTGRVVDPRYFSCAESLSKECSIKGKLKDCSKVMLQDEKIDQFITDLIKKHSVPGISLQYRRSAGALLIVEDGVDVPGRRARTISDNLSFDLMAIRDDPTLVKPEVFVFGEKAPMKVVLDAWQKRQGTGLDNPVWLLIGSSFILIFAIYAWVRFRR